MVVTLDKVKLGIGSYVDKEVIPKMNGFAKWIVGASMVSMPSLIDTKFNESKSVLVDMCVVSDDNHIDIDKAEEILCGVATKYGKVCQNMGGATVTFDATDITKVAQHIRQL